jgi:hypothetical protein
VRAACVTSVLAGLVTTSPAVADPQLNLGLTVGAEARDTVGPDPLRGALHLGGRGSILFLRNRGSDMAVGPYVDVATASFDNLDVGGGLEWLLPVRDDLPIVLSAGAFGRNGDGRSWAPGLEGTTFFGSRSYNFHSSYGLAAGVFVQARWVPESPSTLDLVFGLQIDSELLVLPWVFLYEAVTH